MAVYSNVFKSDHNAINQVLLFGNKKMVLKYLTFQWSQNFENRQIYIYIYTHKENPFWTVLLPERYLCV